MCELTLEAAAMGTSKTIKVDGYTFYVHIERDNDMKAPWIEHDGHGAVIQMDSTTSKPPRGARRMPVDYWYDWRETLKIAKRDGWGLGPQAQHELALKLGREPTKNEVLDYAVERDFEYCRDWLLDRWEWKQLSVYLTDVAGHKLPGTEYAAYCGGVDDSDEGINETATQLAGEIIAKLGGATTLSVKLK